MFVARLAQPAPKTSTADLPAAVLRRAGALLWWSVKAHMADLHGLPRPPEPRSPRLRL